MGRLRSKSLYSVRMRENADQRNLEHGRFFTHCCQCLDLKAIRKQGEQNPGAAVQKCSTELMLWAISLQIF